MRVRFFLVLFAFTVIGQSQQQFSSLMGTVTGIAGDRLTVLSGATSMLFIADADSQIWRGKTTKSLSLLQLNDQVLVRYRRDPINGPVIIDLYANVTHVWGRVSKIASDGFEVEQNFNADPQSSYAHRYRQISFGADTTFEECAAADLRVGRTVDVIGLKTTEVNVSATRIIIYEGNRPTRMCDGARVTSPDGRQVTR